MSYASTLDDLPRPAWIALMVIGFIIFWPIGLGILAYLLWSGKMHEWKQHGCGRWRRRHRYGRGTGNTAFDAYREETLKRLQEEQQAFEEFLGRLRRAKDQQQFDQFMSERRSQPDPGNPTA